MRDDIKEIMELARSMRDEALEEAAKLADEHCQYCTRLCDHKLEDICTACRVARDIRDLKSK